MPTAATITAAEMLFAFVVLLWNSEKPAYTINITSTRFHTSNAMPCTPEEERAVNSSAK